MGEMNISSMLIVPLHVRMVYIYICIVLLVMSITGLLANMGEMNISSMLIVPLHVRMVYIYICIVLLVMSITGLLANMSELNLILLWHTVCIPVNTVQLCVNYEVEQ